MRWYFAPPITAAVILAISCLSAFAQQAGQNQSALIAYGRYLAIAGDCSACHQDPGKNGSPYGGGGSISSPVGPIFVSNITPDKRYGIGLWTFEQFRDALQKGKSPTKGWLYPTMPYTSYTNMSDDDLRALYTYLMKAVPPSEHAIQETKLPFPFMRVSMVGWNMMFLHTTGSKGDALAAAGSVQRGKYVAEALEHCSTCHTPRNVLFAEESSKLLAGAQLGSWYAPNITSDKTGIRDWSDAELTEFLTKGHNIHAVAGGDMGLAVERSLSKLTTGDIAALVAYIKAVPALATGGNRVEVHMMPQPVNIPAVEPQQRLAMASLIDGAGKDGARLYQSACASCHGENGMGSADGKHPDLTNNTTVRLDAPDNLIMTVAYGVHRTINGNTVSMPGFTEDLTDGQIAALVTYVRNSIAQLQTMPILSDDVVRVRAGIMQKNWLIANAAMLANGAIVITLVIIFLIVTGLFRRIRKHSLSAN